MTGGLKARCHVWDGWLERMDRAFSPWIYHLWANPGAVPQAGIVRTFGAGEGERVVRRWRRWPQMGEGVGGWALTDLPRQGSVPSLFLNDKKSEN